jgi:hypothetical protein
MDLLVLSPISEDKENVAENGFFLNQEILKAELAKLMN